MLSSESGQPVELMRLEIELPNPGSRASPILPPQLTFEPPTCLTPRYSGELVHIFLDARLSATAGPCTDADARLRVARPTLSEFLLGQPFDKRGFAFVSGNKASRVALIRALGKMAP